MATKAPKLLHCERVVMEKNQKIATAMCAFVCGFRNCGFIKFIYRIFLCKIAY